MRALTETIHEKFPDYGFKATACGIFFNDENGVVTCEGI